MKNTTEIHKIVDTAAGVIRDHGSRTFGSNGEAYARGYLQSMLAHVLIELNEIDPKAAERFFARLENFNPEL
jgi:hypothetical protein